MTNSSVSLTEFIVFQVWLAFTLSGVLLAIYFFVVGGLRFTPDNILIAVHLVEIAAIVGLVMGLLANELTEGNMTAGIRWRR